MPLRRGKDATGMFYRWGNHGKKYYYNSASDQAYAKQKAIKQGYAIEISESKHGHPSFKWHF